MTPPRVSAKADGNRPKRHPLRSRLSGALLGLMLGSAVGVGCQRQAAPPLDFDIIAMVDGAPISRPEFESELARARERGQADGQAILENLIQRERLVARARRLGLEEDAEVVRAHKGMLIARMKERELDPRLASANSDTTNASRPTATAVPSQAAPMSRLAIIRVGLSPKASLRQRQAAEAKIAAARERSLQLPAGTMGFGALAYECSDDDATRHKGGDLGWLSPTPGQYHFDAQALAAGFALRSPGEISEVVRGADGLYLVRLIERQARARGTSETDENLTRHKVHLEKRRALELAFAEETRQMIPVTLNPDAIAETIRAFASDLTPPPAPGH